MMIPGLFIRVPTWTFLNWVSMAAFLVKGGVWEYYTPIKILYNNEHGLQFQEPIHIKPTNIGKCNLQEYI